MQETLFQKVSAVPDWEEVGLAHKKRGGFGSHLYGRNKPFVNSIQENISRSDAYCRLHSPQAGADGFAPPPPPAGGEQRLGVAADAQVVVARLGRLVEIWQGWKTFRGRRESPLAKFPNPLPTSCHDCILVDNAWDLGRSSSGNFPR